MPFLASPAAPESKDMDEDAFLDISADGQFCARGSNTPAPAQIFRSFNMSRWWREAAC
jgi:hypothetical protein